MCGIAGGYWSDGRDGHGSRIQRALIRLRHRGPDDEGVVSFNAGAAVVAMGQTRLSVIDLSEGGHQPMTTRDGRYTIVFNGEIYNYRELRDELRRRAWPFATESDTEVLLACWSTWGAECLHRLDGMFAFGVYDRLNQTLTCVRDAFGIKPLFILQERGRFFFASEIAAILEMSGLKIEPDLQQAYDYLVNGDYDSTERSFIDRVHHLLPGHLVEIRSGQGETSPRRWYELPTAQTSKLTFADAAAEVRERFLQNVRLHLRSDVPLGAALSGGIDSSAIVCAMRAIEPDRPIHTFSYIASGSSVSEEHWVDMVNAHVGAVPHKVFARPDDLVNDIDKLIELQGEPFGSTSIYAQHRVFELARENGMTVLLEGQGADELLAGYSGYPGYRMASMLDEGRILAIHRFASNWSAWPGRSYREAMLRFAGATIPDSLYAAARSIFGRNDAPPWLDIAFLKAAGVTPGAPQRVQDGQAPKGRRLAGRLAYEAQARVLPALLRHGDRNSMYFSIEGRVPFLTLPLAQLSLSLPEEYLVSLTGETKSVFRAAMRGIVPDAILDRRDKIGFATPELEWLRTIAPKAREWLMDARAVPFLNADVVMSEFDAVLTGERSFDWQVWRWINYVRWYRLNVTSA